MNESVEKPLLYYRNNLVSMINLLDCQIEYGVPNMVFSSSCTVYGQPDRLPVTEDTPRKDAESPYGNTKRVNEDILRDSVAANPELRGLHFDILILSEHIRRRSSESCRLAFRKTLFHLLRRLPPESGKS